ncbi:uncharacterized protein LOC102808143 [Saccoglossus kowalevskii]
MKQPIYMYVITVQCVQHHHGKGNFKRQSCFNQQAWSQYSEEDLFKILSDAVTPLWRLPYQQQLQLKYSVNQDILRLLTQRTHYIGDSEHLDFIQFSNKNDGLPCVIENTKPSPQTESTRNKCELSVGVGYHGDRKTVGFFIGQMRSECYVVKFSFYKTDKKNDVYEKFLRSSSLDVMLDFQDGGFWRHCTVRTNLKGDVMVVVKIHPQNLSKDELRKHKDELKNHFLHSLKNDITSLYIQESIHMRETHESCPYELLYGEPYIYEKILNKFKFRISPDSFFQTNTLAANVLYKTIKDLCQVTNDTTLVDICCGTGTIGIVMAESVKKVIGIELISQAVDDAKLNAKLNSVRAHFIGKSRVEWKEEKDEKIYKAEKMYFEEKCTIWGKDKNDNEGEDPELCAGDHEIPFKFQLPSEGLPCSFEGQPYGYIRYFIKAYIDIPWKFDPATKRAFTVSGIPLDLNKLNYIQNPVHGHDDKSICCLCCASGPILLDVCTDKKGYTSGEHVSITLSLENITEREIITKSSFIQEVSFTAYKDGTGNKKNRREVMCVSEIKHGSCEPHDSISWGKHLLLIPPLPATGLEGSPYIDVSYRIEVEAVVVGTVFHLFCKLPIIIGNIPVRSAAPSAEEGTENTAVNVPPPSYEALFSGKTNIRDKDDDEYTHGQMEFTPRYVYYNWGNSKDKRKSRPVSTVSQITYYGSL